MADNVTLNEGTGGSTIKTDDDGTAHWQYVKLAFGADNTQTRVSTTNPLPVEGADAENAAITANPLAVGGRYDATPRTLGDGDVGAIALDADGAVQISDGGNAITVDGTVTANAGTGPWPVTDNGGSLTVDGTVTETNSAAILADTANMDTNLGTIAGAVSGTEMQVDVLTSALPTGAATAANQSTGNTSLGNIDTNTTNLPNVIGTDGSAGPTSVLSVGGTEAGGAIQELRVDSDGHLQIDVLSGGGGGTQYAVDDALGATPTGTLAVGIRDDALSALTPVEGDAVGLRVDATGALWIATDDTITVDGSGVTQPVSGTVTETNSAAILADTANMDTNLGTLAGAVSGTEMQVDIVAALPAGSNSIGTLGANSGVDIGDVDILSIAAGSNLIGDVGLSGARTSGGTTLYKNIDVDESEDEIKGTGGQVYWIHAINLTASPLYLKLYNATAATVVVGSTAPDLTFPIPTQGDTNGAGFTLSIPNGIAFSTAITLACTTGLADADAGAPGANACVVNLGYA